MSRIFPRKALVPALPQDRGAPPSSSMRRPRDHFALSVRPYTANHSPSPPSASMKKRINVCEGEVRRVCFGPPRKLCSWRIRVLWEWAMESEDEWWRRFWFVYLFIFLLFGNYGG
ncbi:hypothetical protein AVEN_80643-1 [Araneus ventricosus]|uniref:Uncharacterized protein n=1 Tax=Araneus ventricosus TaxID=182803 RepID=A0A4Y2P2M0_ARAVE|nr:hypothetical protein AVEN_80643-1 [Araneus ventricosus]